MEKSEFELPDTYEMCCGKQKCPAIERLENGACISAPLGEMHEVFLNGEKRAAIVMNDDQARELKRWLEQKGF